MQRRRQHLVEAEALGLLLKRHLAYERIEQAALPFHVVVTEMLSGHEIVLSHGSGVNVVVASAAIRRLSASGSRGRRGSR
jgi:NTE family protein